MCHHFGPFVDINRISIGYPIILGRITGLDYWIGYFFHIRGLLWCVPRKAFSPVSAVLRSSQGRLFFVNVSRPPKIHICLFLDKNFL